MLQIATPTVAAGSQRPVTWRESHPEANYRQQQQCNGWAAKKIKPLFQRFQLPASPLFIKVWFNNKKAAGQVTAHLGKKITCKTIYF